MSPSRPAPAGTVEIWFSHGNLLECSQGIIYTGPRPAHRISNLYGTRDSSFKDNINRVADDELCEAGTNIGVSICVSYSVIAITITICRGARRLCYRYPRVSLRSLYIPLTRRYRCCRDTIIRSLTYRYQDLGVLLPVLGLYCAVPGNNINDKYESIRAFARGQFM